MARPRTLPADPARMIGDALLAAMREAAASNCATGPAWRTLTAEGAARGFPSTRSFREWCYRAGVPVREVAGVSHVQPSAVDAVFTAVEDRTPPASVVSPDTEADDRLADSVNGRRRRR